ncbi:Na+/H+ antiporter NhaA [Sphingomonas sinipercae]|uniref:Na(+)/H(+) antiporter NhaA n=1 Tax=Sphingomonas sinipercae TaxID=2714944 RepID=A0A6G7ZL81_9SPHN|nr:Na+/H+ antiporter NhaA [Sphingomonas sinipercae]QIL01678.1 Na+/H+ antiporter NhaA [Sphingomonas sinipercae]
MGHDAAKTRREERNAGLLLIAAAALALLAANSAAGDFYHHILDYSFGPSLPRIGVPTVHLWVADALMALFFLLVGLEVKREWYEGRLSTAAERRLPFIAAAAGMALPALVFISIVQSDPSLINGWAIPAATDIAFAIGILALLGSRASPSIKLLLVTIAIIDDVGAVLIIALFYTADLSVYALGASLVIAGVMAFLNVAGVRRLWPYLVLAAFLWFAVLASGIHATIAGVVAALTIPLGRGEAHSPLRKLEHTIHPWVMFGVVPLFGFVSAGVHVGSIGEILRPLPLAIGLGLFVGKQTGVFGAIWLAVRSGLAPRPAGANWQQIYGAAMLCGIGFTMSLFIGALAFPGQPEAVEAAKLGTLGGSFLAAVGGWLVLRTAGPAEPVEEDASEAAEIFGEDWMADRQP